MDANSWKHHNKKTHKCFDPLFGGVITNNKPVTLNEKLQLLWSRIHYHFLRTTCFHINTCPPYILIISYLFRTFLYVRSISIIIIYYHQFAGLLRGKCACGIMTQLESVHIPCVISKTNQNNIKSFFIVNLVIKTLVR